MTDAFAFQGPEKGDCGCGCGAFGTLKRAWKDGSRCVGRVCKCKRCQGKNNRTRGDAKARKVKAALKLTGNSRHEEVWRGLIRVEVKSGPIAGPINTRYRACRAQSDASKAIGDTRPFAACFSHDGLDLAVLAVSDLARILEVTDTREVSA